MSNKYYLQEALQNLFEAEEEVDYEAVSAAQERYQKARNDYKEAEAEYDAFIDSLGDLIGDDGKVSDETLKAIKEKEVQLNLSALKKEMEEAEKHYRELNKKYYDTLAKKEKEKEKQAIAKSGLSEADYFRKLAKKEFRTTSNFKMAGYLLPDGSMLDFSGGSGGYVRGEDHRRINVIFADSFSSGSEAMLKFMGQGNIRLMPETPGVDIAKDCEPTSAQYNKIRNMILTLGKSEGYFSVDFTDTASTYGYTVGSLQYEDTIRPDKIINDIKHYFATGEIRDDSESVSRFHEELLEDLQSDYEKYYSSLPQDLFLKLVSFDPTYTGTGEMSDNKGKFTRWILDRYLKKDVTEIDFGHIKDCLTRFKNQQGRLEKKDINQYKTLAEIDTALNDAEANRTANQIVKDNQKAMRNTEYENDKVLSTGKWDVYVPSSYKNSCAIAHKGDDEDHYTKWCTAATDSDYYYNYYKEEYGGEYYIIINKNDPHEKYQFHFESEQFMNAEDTPIDVRRFIEKNTELKKYFYPKVMASFLDWLGKDEDDIEFLENNKTIHVEVELDDILSYYEKIYSNDKIDADFIKEFLEDAYYAFDRYWHIDSYSYFLYGIKDEDLFSNPTIKEYMTKNNLTVKDFKNILDYTYDGDFEEVDELREYLRDAIWNAYSESNIRQVKDAIESAFENTCQGSVINYENKTLSCDIELNDLIANFFNGDTSEYDFYDYICKYLGEDFSLTEPYYGWNDFDLDIFIKEFASLL